MLINAGANSTENVGVLKTLIGEKLLVARSRAIA